MSALAAQLPRRSSIAVWTLLSLTVIVFSYLLTLVIALVLGLFGVAFLVFALRDMRFGGLILGLLAVLISGTIFWSIFPRRDKRAISGVPIDLAAQPRLRALLLEIASSLDQPLPAEVWLVADANAFVTEIRGKRILGIGLPLLAAMPLSEFAAVLAHEFAHFYAGDSRLGPRIYKSRESFARTLRNLSGESVVRQFLTRFAIAALLYMIVVGALAFYWRFFLRITNYVSRRQEFRSDQLACAIAGSAAMGAGLQRVSRLGPVAPAFWRTVIHPSVNAGLRLPIADGFERYLLAPHIEQAMTAACAQLIEKTKSSPNDSHPPLRQRLDRIAAYKLPGISQCGAGRAIDLIDNVEKLEQQLIHTLAPNLQKELIAMDWDSAGAGFWLPYWRKSIAGHQSFFEGAPFQALPALVQRLSELAQQIPNPPGLLLTKEQRVERASGILRITLAVGLSEHGWQIHYQPAVLHLCKGDEKLSPAEVVNDLRSGKTSSAQWQEWCQTHDLLDVPLLNQPNVQG